jgi:cell division protease FtsH
MKFFYFLFLIELCQGFVPSHHFKTINTKYRLKMTADSPSEIITQVSRTGFGKTWTYQNFLDNLDHNKIDSVSVLSDQKGFIAVDTNHDTSIVSDNLHYIKTLPNVIDDLLPRLYSHHTNFDILTIPNTESIGNNFGQIFSSFIYLPIIYIAINAILFFLRGGNRGNGLNNNINPMNFLSNEVEVLESKDVETRFNDVAGCEEAKFELVEVVDFLKNPDKYQEAGAKVPKGVLLEGKPGTGKTLLARAVAGEAGVSFISASGSEFIEMFVGVGASRVRKLFDQAKKKSPCVIFIDEIDAIGRQRGAGVNSGNDEREQTLNQILTNMDGFTASSGIIVLAATNRADILDSALVRPGRFDRKVNVPLPDIQGRKDIFNVHFRNKKLDKEIDLNEIAVLTSGFSGADIANLANEAAILSVRQNKTEIDKGILLDAYEKITIGLPSLSQEKDKNIIELVAYHEIGHALMVKYFEEFFDLRKVTINSNKGGAGGFTLFTPKERYINYPTKKFMLANLVTAMGGRAAEVVLYSKNNVTKTDVVFKDIDNLEITTGASNDLKQANSIARQYVSIFGLSDDFALTGQRDLDSQPFLGKELALTSDRSSEYMKEKTDIMVADLINTAYKVAINIIKSNPDDFHNLSNQLIEKRNLNILDFKNITLIY